MGFLCSCGRLKNLKLYKKIIFFDRDRNLPLQSGKQCSSDSEDEAQVTPLNSFPNQLNTALDEFRQNWQDELKPSVARRDQSPESSKEKLADTINDGTTALDYFARAVNLERSGKVYDALIYYRKAVQIDPDIEFKFTDNNIKSQARESTPEVVNENSDTMCENIDAEDLSKVDLFQRFQNDLKINQYFVRKTGESNVIVTSKHISDLPIEILHYIFRWVVSSQLDIRSLEQIALVCKGFYLCARDSELWRLICYRVWGSNTGTLANSPYSSWREMFLERKRVRFNGCYISKTTYLRYGENNFQDQNYRPIQLIEYFRYFRFSPDGTVLVWTTAEEPSQAVYKLKNVNSLRPEILTGHFRFHGDIVTITVRRNVKQNSSSGAKRGAKYGNDNESSYTYFIELKIVNHNNRRFCQLQWHSYSIVQLKNKQETTTDYDLTPSKYPPMWFSRVKSYHQEADAALQFFKKT